MKTEFELSEDRGCRSLAVRGDLTAQSGEQFKKHLHQLMEGSTDRMLSLKEVKSMDVSSLQLIQAFKTTTAKQSGIQVDLPDNGELLDLLQKTELIKVLHTK